MKGSFYFGCKGFAAAGDLFRSTHGAGKFKIFPKAGISNPHEKMPVTGSWIYRYRHLLMGNSRHISSQDMVAGLSLRKERYGRYGVTLEELWGDTAREYNSSTLNQHLLQQQFSSKEQPGASTALTAHLTSKK